MSTSTADVSVGYYKPDGSNWPADAANTGPFTVTANFGQKIIAQYFDTTMTAGQGSAIVSSSQPMASVVQIQARNQTPSMGAYNTISPSNQFYVPQVLRQRTTVQGLANTQITIQNADSSAITATVHFEPYPGSGFSTFDKTGISLNPGASLLYDVADESSSNLPDGWFGSALVTAQPSKMIDVMSNLFFGSNSLATYSAFPAEVAGSGWALPQFVSRLPNNLSTPVIVQNVSGGTIPTSGITMTCKSAISSPATMTLTNTTSVANNAAYAFNPVTDLTITGNWTGSCFLMTSSQNVMVLVQMRFPGSNDNFDAYPALRSTSTYTKVVVPLISKRQLNGFATAAVVQNLDQVSTADVTFTYYPSAAYVAGGGSAATLAYNRTIPAGGNYIHNHRLTDLGDGIATMPDGWYGTLVVTPQSPGTARPLVGFAQLTNYLNPAGDTWMTHDAFTLP